MVSDNDILNLSDKDYSIYISNLLKEEDAIYLIDEIDDQLLEIVKTHPAEVERLCKINSAVFAQVPQDELRNNILAYNFNTLMIASISQSNIKEAKAIFIKGIVHCKETNQYSAGKSLSQNIFHLFESAQIAVDEAPFLLSKITEFYKVLGKHKDSIEALCAAAQYFADVSAFQPAYRAIYDAQEIAKETKNMEKSQILILETNGRVALAEGDLNCADIEFQKCLEIYKYINEPPSFELRANIALVKLRQKDYLAAKEIYELLITIHTESPDDIHTMQIKTNLLVCYRELRESESFENLSRLIEAEIGAFNLEFRIEARLILAKSYFQIDKGTQGSIQLKTACIDVQEQIDQYYRLHYRRGVRERYLPRVRHMLPYLNNSGNSEDIVYMLASCSSNALLDWLSVLEWVDHVKQSEKIALSQKQELAVKIKELINYGTPFLYGYREKYDDPFEQANNDLASKVGEEIARATDYSLPWREFNYLVSHICQEYTLPSPFAGATIQNCVDLLTKKQLSSSGFLFSFICNEISVIILLYKNKFLKVEIPTTSIFEFSTALYKYQHDTIERNQFNNDLNSLNSILEPAVSEIIDTLINNPISEIVFVPDYFTEGLPLLPIIIANDQLRLRINHSTLSFRSCPALKQGLDASSFSGPGVFVSNSDESLKLVESEKYIIKKALKEQSLLEIDLEKDEIDFSEQPLKKCSLFHLSTHNIPASSFTDPFFVSTSLDTSKNGIWLESIQRESNQFQFTLAVLNGCNTGTTSNWNYFKSFLTNEKVGMTSLFILNRQCTVVATQWNEPDIISYIFTSVLYKRLSKEKNYGRAFILALLDLYELSKVDAINLLSEISDESLREEKSNMLRRAPVDFPFRNTYTLGMFQCFSLIPKN